MQLSKERTLSITDQTLTLEVPKKRNHQQSSSFWGGSTGKTSLSAWINIWINPGFLMQSGGLRHLRPSFGSWMSSAEPWQLKEISWNLPAPFFSLSAHSQQKMEAHSCVKWTLHKDAFQ